MGEKGHSLPSTAGQSQPAGPGALGGFFWKENGHKRGRGGRGERKGRPQSRRCRPEEVTGTEEGPGSKEVGWAPGRRGGAGVTSGG